MRYEKDSLGTRMKSYESCYDLKLTPRMPYVLRVDGSSFHTRVKKWKCEKPFDKTLVKCMQATAKYLCSEIQGAVLAYTQSDEISILIIDDLTNSTESWVGKRQAKICSLAASKATNAFNLTFLESCINNDDVQKDFGDKIMQPNFWAEFDARAFVLPYMDIINYFIWRQQDCSRNSISMVAHANFPHKQLAGKDNKAKMDMLMTEKQINWDNFDTHLKRGSCLIKTQKTIKGKNGGTFIRNKWEIDFEIPIFTQDREYINREIEAMRKRTEHQKEND